MKFRNQFMKTIVLAAFITLAACSQAPVIQEFADTASPRDEIARLDADLDAALAKQVNVLAPNSFESASEALNAAKIGLEKQKDSKDILHQVAKGRAYLDRSNQGAIASHANIEDVVVARQQAVAAGAPGYFFEDFKAADDQLKEVTSDLEKSDVSSAASNRSAFQAMYLDLELRSIKLSRLGQARAIIDLSIKEGAKDFAARTLAIAEKNVKDTDAFITANRHDVDQVKKRSDVAQLSADHLLKITRESKAGKKTSPEDTALKIENEQQKVAESQSQIAQKQVQVLEGKTALKALSAENQNLENEQAFNKSFDEARALFSKDEAEVYKQGNTLMIRLRGLEFPSAQAVLKGSNFPLLAKVQSVIRDFGNNSVVVEGHTDSQGGPALNAKLSTDRAEAVKAYFVANTDSDIPMSIKAVGYGYQKPLASNKTSTGRAQNRRVDVLIERAETQAAN